MVTIWHRHHDKCVTNNLFWQRELKRGISWLTCYRRKYLGSSGEQGVEESVSGRWTWCWGSVMPYSDSWLAFLGSCAVFFWHVVLLNRPSICVFLGLSFLSGILASFSPFPHFHPILIARERRWNGPLFSGYVPNLKFCWSNGIQSLLERKSHPERLPLWSCSIPPKALMGHPKLYMEV